MSKPTGGYNKYTASTPPTYGGYSFEDTDETTTTEIPLSSTNSQYYSAPKITKPKVRKPWSTGLFGCFSDIRNCCITLWCPCVTFGQIAEIIDKGSSACGINGGVYAIVACVSGCACCLSCFYRAKMRQQYSLKESPCGDCLVHFCCEYCALCQEYRELKSRGIRVPLGWHGNVEKINHELELSSEAPEVEQGMSRSL